MKKFAFLIFILLAGCEQLMRGQVEQVKIIDIKNNMMMISCSGPAGSWSDCSNAATAACEKGYEVVERRESIPAALRQLTFKCH